MTQYESLEAAKDAVATAVEMMYGEGHYEACTWKSMWGEIPGWRLHYTDICNPPWSCDGYVLNMGTYWAAFTTESDDGDTLSHSVVL